MKLKSFFQASYLVFLISAFLPHYSAQATDMDLDICNPLLAEELGSRPSSIEESFTPHQVAGLKEIDEYLQFSKELRSGGVDQRVTHIPFFESKLGEHLNFIESEIRKQTDSPDQRQRLSILEDFKSEAASRKGSVTYRWWILFNFRLSILATPGGKRTPERGSYPDKFIVDLYKTGDWLTTERLEKSMTRNTDPGFFGTKTIGTYIDMFPDVIMAPLLGDLGMFTLNKTFMTGVFPMGLSGEPIWADGREMYPDHFFGHDLVHLTNHVFSTSRWESRKTELAVEEFHDSFMETVEHLSPIHRKQAEFVYFLTTHELTLFASDLVSSSAVKSLRKTLFGTRLEEMVKSTMDSTWYANLVSDVVNVHSEEDVRKFLLSASQTFQKVADRIYSNADRATTGQTGTADGSASNGVRAKPKAPEGQNDSSSDVKDAKYWERQALKARRDRAKEFSAAGITPQINLEGLAVHNGYRKIRHIDFHGMEHLTGRMTNVGLTVITVYIPTGGQPVQMSGTVTREYQAGFELTDNLGKKHDINVNFGKISVVYVKP